MLREKYEQRARSFSVGMKKSTQKSITQVVLATCGIRPPIEPFEYIQPDRSSLADYPE
jgi:hypothetical protein